MSDGDRMMADILQDQVNFEKMNKEFFQKKYDNQQDGIKEAIELITNGHPLKAGNLLKDLIN